MIWLVLSILASTGLFVIFEWIRKHDVFLFPSIVINYLICSLCGNFLLGELHIFQASTLNHPGFPYMLFMGGMFIGTFFLMGLATTNAGSAKASVASKMSVIIPVLVAMLVLNQSSTAMQLTGILVGLLCVYFITKRNAASGIIERSHLWVLLLVFIGSGLVDTGLNLLSHYYGNAHPNSPVFISTFIFSGAFVLGLLAYFLKVRKKQKMGFAEVVAGIVLGLVNFFSLFCVFKSLEHYASNSAYYWMLNNIGVVLLSTLISVFIFKRKLDRDNYIGVFLAVLAIVLLNI